jgi:hypothetical protein
LVAGAAVSRPPEISNQTFYIRAVCSPRFSSLRENGAGLRFTLPMHAALHTWILLPPCGTYRFSLSLMLTQTGQVFCGPENFGDPAVVLGLETLSVLVGSGWGGAAGSLIGLGSDGPMS